MDYLALLSLLQKNFRLINNRQGLRDFLFSNKFFQPSSNTAFDLTTPAERVQSYLQVYEPSFFLNVLAHKKALGTEAERIAIRQAAGIRFTYPGEAAYPTQFCGLQGAPILLSYEGPPAWCDRRALAVVGSRDASVLSRRWMEDSFATFLQQERPVVVSGGARGIDQMAHQLALRNHCPTIAVLPSGLGAVYPASLRDLKRKIIDGGGCLLSEYFYEQEMLKHFFLDRNRLIAALGAITLLVEAKRRSGSLITAQRALEFGKSVFVIPGHPSDLSHLGNIDLLTEGATPIRDAQDLRSYFRSELGEAPNVSPIASQMFMF
jgi:DNA processing protein